VKRDKWTTSGDEDEEQVDMERGSVLPPDFERWPPVCQAEELECDK